MKGIVEDLILNGSRNAIQKIPRAGGFQTAVVDACADLCSGLKFVNYLVGGCVAPDQICHHLGSQPEIVFARGKIPRQPAAHHIHVGFIDGDPQVNIVLQRFNHLAGEPGEKNGGFGVFPAAHIDQPQGVAEMMQGYQGSHAVFCQPARHFDIVIECFLVPGIGCRLNTAPLH